MLTSTAFQPKRPIPHVGDIVTIKANRFAYGIEVQGLHRDRLHGKVVEAPHREAMGRTVDIGQRYICWDERVSA
jgi:hypothetical protein